MFAVWIILCLYLSDVEGVEILLSRCCGGIFVLPLLQWQGLVNKTAERD